MTIVDVTIKSSIIQISRTTYSLVSYTHQGWLTTDHAYLLMDDELDELHQSSLQGHTRTLIWDVRSLKSPQNTGKFTSLETSIGNPENFPRSFPLDHNQYIHHGYSWQANYCAGLRVLDVSSIASASLLQVAYFDVSPSCSTTDWLGP